MSKFSSGSSIKLPKIKNDLILNYERQIGKTWKLKSVTSETDNRTGSVHVFPEYLVPGTSDTDHNIINSLANALFMEARLHNMSLSPFGRLDPQKFCLAATYLTCLMAELKRNFGIVSKFQFGNTTYGKALAKAVDIDYDDALGRYADYVKAYNILAAKVNALYVPVTGLSLRWLQHRLTVYHDDEGERYQLYLYRMANYYELITDPNSPQVGQLIFKFISLQNNDNTLGILMQNINNLVDNYMSDDDFAAFCTEAKQAGMKSIEIEMLETSLDGIPVVPLREEFSLDDVMSLENASYVYPIKRSDFVGSPYASNWDLIEDPSTNSLTFGRYNGSPNALPCYIYTALDTVLAPVFGTNGIDAKAYTNFDELPIRERPIFTHAKVKSVPGLTNLLRYVVGYGSREQMAVVVGTANIQASINGVVVTATTSNPTLINMLPITAFGTEMLGGHFAVFIWPNGNVQVDESERAGIVFANDSNYFINGLENYLWHAEMCIGFKAHFVSIFVDIDSDACYLLTGDFDYITSITEDNYNTFVGTNAWNDTQIVGAESPMPEDIHSGKSKSNNNQPQSK